MAWHNIVREDWIANIMNSKVRILLTVMKWTYRSECNVSEASLPWSLTSSKSTEPWVTPSTVWCFQAQESLPVLHRSSLTPGLISPFRIIFTNLEIPGTCLVQEPNAERTRSHPHPGWEREMGGLWKGVESVPRQPWVASVCFSTAGQKLPSLQHGTHFVARGHFCGIWGLSRREHNL